MSLESSSMYLERWYSNPIFVLSNSLGWDGTVTLFYFVSYSKTKKEKMGTYNLGKGFFKFKLIAESFKLTESRSCRTESTVKCYAWVFPKSHLAFLSNFLPSHWRGLAKATAAPGRKDSLKSKGKHLNEKYLSSKWSISTGRDSETTSGFKL